MSTESARLAFKAYCEEIGSTCIAEEDAILSVGEDFLPSYAIAVLKKTGKPTERYYEWLLSQTEEAQAEHEREVNAGKIR